jgi:ABC-type polysaccharide/polyol phosphate export permease
MVELQGGLSVTGYLSDIWRLRHFWSALVRIDLRNRYRRSMIGIGWSLLHPIAMTLVLCVMFHQLFGLEMSEYGPYVLSGLIFWNFITAGMNQGCQCFFQGESYIRQHPAPLAIYPLRTALGAGIHFLFGLCVLLPFVWMVNGFGNLPALLSLVPTLALLFIFCWALAICMGVLNVLFQDCQHLIEVLLQVLFYLTPIMYRPEKLNLEGSLLRIFNLNPLAIMLRMLRQPILEGQLPSLHTYELGLSVAALATVAAVLTLMRFERRIIFYL